MHGVRIYWKKYVNSNVKLYGAPEKFKSHTVKKG